MPTNKLPPPPGKPSAAGRAAIRKNSSLAHADGSPADHEQRVIDLYHVAHEADLAWSREMAYAQAAGVSYRRLAAITGTNESTMQSRVREGRRLIAQENLAQRKTG